VKGGNMKTIDIALSGLFTGLYAAGVIFLAPLSFFIIQVRLIDCLIPLSSIFGLPLIFGVSVGNIVANIYGGLGIIDIIGGTVANLLASLFVYYIFKREFSPITLVLINLVATLIITIIVGGYLSLILFVPIEFSLLGLFIGSLISITGLGSAIQIILLNQNIDETLRKYD
jgi:hypothetical protein